MLIPRHSAGEHRHEKLSILAIVTATVKATGRLVETAVLAGADLLHDIERVRP